MKTPGDTEGTETTAHNGTEVPSVGTTTAHEASDVPVVTKPAELSKKEHVLKLLNEGVTNTAQILLKLNEVGVSMSVNYIDGIRAEWRKATGQPARRIVTAADKNPTIMGGGAPESGASSEDGSTPRGALKAAVIRLYNSGVTSGTEVAKALVSEGFANVDPEKPGYVYKLISDYKKASKEAAQVALTEGSKKDLILGLSKELGTVEPAKIVEAAAKLGRTVTSSYVYNVMNEAKKHAPAPTATKKGKTKANPDAEFEGHKPASTEDADTAFLKSVDPELRVVMNSLAQEHGLNTIERIIKGFRAINNRVKIRVA